MDSSFQHSSDLKAHHMGLESQQKIFMALYGAFDLVTGIGKIVKEYWEEELDHQNQPTFLA